MAGSDEGGPRIDSVERAFQDNMAEVQETTVHLRKSHKGKLQPAPVVKEERVYNGELNKQLIGELLQIKIDEEFASKLAEFLLLKDHHTNARSSIELDLYICILRFGSEWGLSEDKLLTFFTIAQKLHKHVVANKPPFDSAFEFFRNLVVANTVPAPNASFVFADSKRIIDYISESLYIYVFSEEQETETTSVTCVIETVNEIPPLSDAKPMADWIKEQERIQKEKEEKEQELKRLRDTFGHAFQEEAKVTGEPAVLPDEVIKTLTVESIHGIAASFTVQQINSFKEAIAHQIEAQEKHVVDSVATKIEERRKLTPRASTDNVRGRTPESTRKMKNKKP